MGHLRVAVCLGFEMSLNYCKGNEFDLQIEYSEACFPAHKGPLHVSTLMGLCLYLKRHLKR